MKRIILSLSLFTFSFNAHSLYIVKSPENTVQLEQVTDGNHKFQDVCRIFSEFNDGITTNTKNGTGTLISPKVVVTALHVVSSEPGTLAEPTNVSVTFNDKTYKVQEIVAPQRKNLDMALLVLTENVQHITPRHVRSVQPGEQIPAITFAGFGKGRIITDDEEDIELETSANLQGSNTLRYIENIQGPVSPKIDPRKHNVILTETKLKISEEKLQAPVKFLERLVEHNKQKDVLQKKIYELRNSIKECKDNQQQESLRTQLKAAEQTLDNHYAEGNNIKLDVSEYDNKLAAYEAEDIKNAVKNIFDLPMTLILSSKEIMTGSGDSGGPTLDQQGNLIGVIIESTVADPYSEKDILSIFMDEKRGKNYNIARFGSLALAAAPLAYLASAYGDTSLLLSSGIGLASAALLSKIADYVLTSSPSQLIYEHFYIDPMYDVVAKSNKAMLDNIKQKGFADNMSAAITDDIKSWIDGVIERARK